MADNFRLKVITPGGTARETLVVAVTLPTQKGEVGVLPKHIGYTGLITTGLLRYDEAETAERKKIVVGKGFCNFLEEGLMVLVDSVDAPESNLAASLSVEREELLKVVQEGNAYEAAWQEARNKLDRIEAIEGMLKPS